LYQRINIEKYIYFPRDFIVKITNIAYVSAVSSKYFFEFGWKFGSTGKFQLKSLRQCYAMLLICSSNCMRLTQYKIAYAAFTWRVRR